MHHRHDAKTDITTRKKRYDENRGNDLKRCLQMTHAHRQDDAKQTLIQKTKQKEESEKDGSQHPCKLGRMMHYQTKKLPRGTSAESKRKNRKQTLG